MTNYELLIETFHKALEIDKNLIVPNLEYNSIPEWDSVAHMTLISQLEDTFDIMLDTEDIIDMSSVQKAIYILEKYGISTNAN
jgi:acyl carrier protein